MNNPVQTGDGAGMAVQGVKAIVGMFKGDKKNKRKESFSEGVTHDKILRTARNMAKDKYTYKLAKLDKVTGAIKPGTKGEVVTGKTRITGTFAGGKTPAKKATEPKKAMTTKQAAVSVPTPKKAAASTKPKAKAAPAKTPPPTSTRARKVK
jgi:hypothetical protein